MIAASTSGLDGHGSRIRYSWRANEKGRERRSAKRGVGWIRHELRSSILARLLTASTMLRPMPRSAAGSHVRLIQTQHEIATKRLLRTQCWLFRRNTDTTA